MTTAGNIHRFCNALDSNYALNSVIARHAAELLANRCGAKHTSRREALPNILIFHF